MTFGEPRYSRKVLYIKNKEEAKKFEITLIKFESTDEFVRLINIAVEKYPELIRQPPKFL